MSRTFYVDESDVDSICTSDEEESVYDQTDDGEFVGGRYRMPKIRKNKRKGKGKRKMKGGEFVWRPVPGTDPYTTKKYNVSEIKNRKYGYDVNPLLEEQWQINKRKNAKYDRSNSYKLMRYSLWQPERRNKVKLVYSRRYPATKKRLFTWDEYEAAKIAANTPSAPLAVLEQISNEVAVEAPVVNTSRGRQDVVVEVAEEEPAPRRSSSRLAAQQRFRVNPINATTIRHNPKYSPVARQELAEEREEERQLQQISKQVAAEAPAPVQRELRKRTPTLVVASKEKGVFGKPAKLGNRFPNLGPVDPNISRYHDPRIYNGTGHKKRKRKSTKRKLHRLLKKLDELPPVNDRQSGIFPPLIQPSAYVDQIPQGTASVSNKNYGINLVDDNKLLRSLSYNETLGVSPNKYSPLMTNAEARSVGNWRFINQLNELNKDEQLRRDVALAQVPRSSTVNLAGTAGINLSGNVNVNMEQLGPKGEELLPFFDISGFNEPQKEELKVNEEDISKVLQQAGVNDQDSTYQSLADNIINIARNSNNQLTLIASAAALRDLAAQRDIPAEVKQLAQNEANELVRQTRSGKVYNKGEGYSKKRKALLRRLTNIRSFNKSRRRVRGGYFKGITTRDYQLPVWLQSMPTALQGDQTYEITPQFSTSY